MKLNAEGISKLYRNLFTIYFYNPKNAKKLTLEMSESSARSGVKALEIISKSTWLQQPYDLHPQLRKLNIPTLILHGDHDPISVLAVEKISSSIPNSKLVIFKNCGHFPYIEQPEEFFHELEIFFNRTITFIQNNHLKMFVLNV